MDLKEVKNIHPCMDDIITGNKSPHKHLKTLDALLFCLDSCGYKLKLTKCQFMCKAVDFTGWTVTPEGVCISKSKLDGIEKLIKPTILSIVKSLLSFTNFLRAYVPYYSDVVGIIQLLLSEKGLKGNSSIERFWTASHDKALETLKQMLLQNQVLLYPDIAKTCILYTDTSKYHMSSVLMQYDDKGQLVPLGYWSKSFKSRKSTGQHW